MLNQPLFQNFRIYIVYRGSFTTYGIGHRMTQVWIFPNQRVNSEFRSDQIAQDT